MQVQYLNPVLHIDLLFETVPVLTRTDAAPLFDCVHTTRTAAQQPFSVACYVCSAGANAVSTTDSVEMYQGDGKTTLSANHVTTPPSKVAHASKSGSFGSTSWPVGSLAMSGASNGNLLLAQADDAVALVQVERSSEKLDKRLEQDRFKAFAP